MFLCTLSLTWKFSSCYPFPEITQRFLPGRDDCMAADTKTELFETMPVPRTLMRMAIPTIVSQLINLIYNMADTWFIGRAGNSSGWPPSASSA